MSDKRKRGRPSLFTEETKELLIAAIKAGNYMETAAAYAGISKSLLYKYLKLGRQAKSGKLRDFVDSIDAAQAYAEVFSVNTIMKAESSGDWRAAAWRLERMHKHWRVPKELTVSGDATKPPVRVETSKAPEVDLSKFTTEELEQAEKLFQKMGIPLGDTIGEEEDITESWED